MTGPDSDPLIETPLPVRPTLAAPSRDWILIPAVGSVLAAVILFLPKGAAWNIAGYVLGSLVAFSLVALFRRWAAQRLDEDGVPPTHTDTAAATGVLVFGLIVASLHAWFIARVLTAPRMVTAAVIAIGAATGVAPVSQPATTLLPQAPVTQTATTTAPTGTVPAGTAVPPGPTGIAPTPSAIPPSPAAVHLADCVQTSAHLDVLFLIDESGSLGGANGTDPQAARVDGVKAALNGLDRLADTTIDGHAAVSVTTLLAGFSTDFNTAPSFRGGFADPFQVVTDGSLAQLTTEAEGFRDRNTGAWTDYGLALGSAQRLLATHAAQLTAGGGAPPCQAIVFFTDGMYDLPGGPPAVNAGKAQLCRPSGVTDQLRADGVETFSLGLQTELTPADSAFLEAMTDGGGIGCGTTGTSSTGLYLPVRDRSQLFFLFGSLFNPNPPPQISVPGICPAEPCANAAGQFQTFPGLTSFLIRAATGATGTQIILHPPIGDLAMFRPDGAPVVTVGDTPVTERWVSGQDVELAGTFPTQSQQWVGHWTIDFVGNTPARPTYTIQLQATVSPQLVGSPNITLGKEARLQFQLVDQSRTPVASGPLASAQLSAVMTDPTGGSGTSLDVATAAPGQYSAAYLAPLTSTAPAFTLTVAAAFQPVNGVQIATQRRVYTLTRVLPNLYPHLSPLSLHLPSVTGKATTAGTVTVTGDPAAGGCLWLTATAIVAPTDARALTETLSPAANEQSKCLHVNAGQARSVVVTFAPAHAAVGAVGTTVVAHLTSDVNPAPQLVSIPVSLFLQVPPNVTRELAVTLLLMLLGILLPIALIHGLNFAVAYFTPPQLLRAQSFDVIVSPTDGLLTPGSEVRPFTLPPAELPRVQETGKAHGERKLNIEGIVLHTAASMSVKDRIFRLFRGPFGLAGHERLPLLTGSIRGRVRPTRREGIYELPLALGGTWFFRPGRQVVDDDTLETPGPDRHHATGRAGRLTLVIADGCGAEEAEVVLEAANRQLVEAVPTLKDRVPTNGVSDRGRDGRPPTRPADDSQEPDKPADDLGQDI